MAALVLACSAVLVLALPAVAGEFSNPASDPFVVPSDGAGNPLAFDVTLTGMPANTAIQLELCDGVDPATPGWTPALHCDPATNPQPAQTDANGTLTILATSEEAFTPVKGESPSHLFNCLPPGQPNFPNGLPGYSNCRLRADTSLTASSPNQATLVLTLPGNVDPSLPEVPLPVLLPVVALAVGFGLWLFQRRRIHTMVR